MQHLTVLPNPSEKYRLRSIKRDGLPLHFLHIPGRDSHEPIVVFSHGFPGNAYDWALQFEVAAAHGEIVAPFMHGTYDGQGVPKGRLRPEKLLDDMVAILNEVDPSHKRPLLFVGHDLGCFINTTLAQHYPSRTKGVVNINGLGLQQYCSRLPRLSQWLKSYYVLLLQFAPIRRLVADVLPGPSLRLIYRLSGLGKDDAIHAHDKRVFSSIYIYKILLGQAFRTLRRPIRKSAMPTVFIWGHKDVFLNIPTRQEVERFHERGEVRVLRGGHWVNRSNRAHVNRLLAQLLRNWANTPMPTAVGGVTASNDGINERIDHAEI